MVVSPRSPLARDGSPADTHNININIAGPASPARSVENQNLPRETRGNAHQNWAAKLNHTSGRTSTRIGRMAMARSNNKGKLMIISLKNNKPII